MKIVSQFLHSQHCFNQVSDDKLWRTHKTWPFFITSETGDRRPLIYKSEPQAHGVESQSQMLQKQTGTGQISKL